MAKMIDAEALIRAMGVRAYMQTEWTPATAWGVPIVDAEPVVRCKDCIYAKFDKYGLSCTSEYGLFRDVAENDFCSWGSGYDT